MVLSVFETKLLSMAAIGVGSFIVGITPACFVSRAQELQQKLLLSCTLCFGGGVLLATSVLHVLPEVRENMPQHGELIFSCGFLLLYLVDEVVHYFWGTDEDHTPGRHRHGLTKQSSAGLERNARSRGYSQQYTSGTGVRSGACITEGTGSKFQPYQSTPHGNNPGLSTNSWKSATTYGTVAQYNPSAPAPCCNEESTFLCHGNHIEPCSGTNTGLVGLLVALTIHSILEGLAIGLQKEYGEVLLLVGAVASHKFVVGFCLGLELAGAGNSVCRLALAIFVFAGGSVLGIGIGMLTYQGKKGWSDVALPLLQGLAGGTLLYVTVSEVLPRERARWHRSARRSAGILQFLSTGVGFVLIFLLNNYVST